MGPSAGPQLEEKKSQKSKALQSVGSSWYQLNSRIEKKYQQETLHTEQAEEGETGERVEYTEVVWKREKSIEIFSATFKKNENNSEDSELSFPISEFSETEIDRSGREKERKYYNGRYGADIEDVGPSCTRRPGLYRRLETIAYSHHIPRVTIQHYGSSSSSLEDEDVLTAPFDQYRKLLQAYILEREQKEREVEIYEVHHHGA